jgi:hypothetical protein
VNAANLERGAGIAQRSSIAAGARRRISSTIASRSTSLERRPRERMK